MDVAKAMLHLHCNNVSWTTQESCLLVAEEPLSYKCDTLLLELVMLHVKGNFKAVTEKFPGATFGPEDSQHPVGKLWRRRQGCDMQG
eukprot:1151876-Pelagomonas_calceolata.AAC.1